MPYKDEEVGKKRRHEYYLRNREKKLMYAKEYSRKNKKQCRDYDKRYAKKNRERINAYYRTWYEKNKEAQHRRRRKYLTMLRFAALVYYSGDPPNCACCSEKRLEFLSIDHIGGGGAKHRRAMKSSSIYVWLKKYNYPKGFRVLCFNCNISIGIWGYCPHHRNEIAFEELRTIMDDSPDNFNLVKGR